MTNQLDDIVSLCKRRGFFYPGSEIYGGLAGTWDYGPLGIQLKRNLQAAWWRMFVENRDDIYGVDSAILMNTRVWQASGHTGAGFTDVLVEDTETKKRYRADHLLEEHGIDPTDMHFEQMAKAFDEHKIKSPDGNKLSAPKRFNLLFETHIGAIEDDSSSVYLRPETAQGMFVNFKNVVDSLQPDLPFGLAQIGKAFRNEISPRDFLFRLREFEQMEIEYFCTKDQWPEHFDHWREQIYKWISLIGLKTSSISELEVPASDRAHYSERTIDFEFDFPFGKKELYGLAYRTDHDLANHQSSSSKSLEYITKDRQEKIIPHCIEPTFGIERTILAILCSAYTNDKANQRVYLALPEAIAPVLYCVSPLLKNKPELVEKAREVYKLLQSKYGRVSWDDNGNIGKRYRRQDEIGTPWCVVIDFDTLADGTVTVRDRDSLKQTRLKVTAI